VNEVVIKMNTQLVIFVTTPLLESDIKKYGVDYYKKNGLSVWFFNFWPLFSKGHTHKVDIEFKNQINIDSIRTLIVELIKFKRRNAIFLSDVSYGDKRFILYLILTILRIDYSFVDNWYAILPKKNDGIIIAKLKNLIKTIIHPIKQLKKLIYKVCLKKPKYVFMPNKRSFHCVAIAGKKSIIVPYSSFNHDDFLASENEIDNNLLLGEKYFVFIDQYLTKHPDFARAGIKPPVTDKYYNSLNNCFRNLEAQNNIKYVVACHPRRAMEDTLFFDTEEVYCYKTYSLIKNSYFVIAHCSTSIYWAVLLNKPIVFIKTDEMMSTYIENHIETFAKELKQDVYNIDCDYFQLRTMQLNVDNNLYEQFRCNNIVFNPENKLKTYEIIYDTFFNKRLD